MTDEELIARLRKADEYEPLGHDGWEAADRIEALTEQLAAARQDAKAAEAYAEELENEAVLSKAAYEGVSSLLLSVQQDCIKERQRAERLEAKLAKLATAAKPFASIKIKDGMSQPGEIGRTDVTNLRAALAEIKLQSSEFATQKGESHE